MTNHDDMDALREVETAWLADQIGYAIANLAYPVGMGIRPPDDRLQFAAATLFERYIQMIGMARTAAARDMRERCAKVCMNLRHPDKSSESNDWIYGTEACANAVAAIPLMATEGEGK